MYKRQRLDWPNDVVVGGAKLSGVLVESRGLEPERPHYVLGIGLNVRQGGFPPELAAERAVTSLLQLGVEATVDAAAGEVLRALAPRLEQVRRDPDGLCAEFAGATGCLGRAVRVRAGARSGEGRLSGLSLAGGLVIEEPGGASRRFALEHVTALEPLPGP